jgi:primary-amine oxidase
LTPTDNIVQQLRFVAVSLLEPPKKEYLSHQNADNYNITIERMAQVIALNPSTGVATEYHVDLDQETLVTSNDLPLGTQPMFTPEDCVLGESIVLSNQQVQKVLYERYGITDMSRVACDPWSVHLALAEEDDPLVHWRANGTPGRLAQVFLYERQYGEGFEDNHYAHPIDIVPVVDLNARKLVCIQGLDRPPPKIPSASVQYHRNLLSTNSYLETSWRKERLATLDIVQPDGPSFTVDGNLVKWQKWSFRVGFNYREGLVMHDVTYNGRPILHRASLVEMAVPYGDPRAPFQRKCAFDVGDYGLGFCADSLERLAGRTSRQEKGHLHARRRCRNLVEACRIQKWTQ